MNGSKKRLIMKEKEQIVLERTPRSHSIPRYNSVTSEETEYQYRFRTQEEFESDYGTSWRDEVWWSESDGMDYLFGVDLPTHKYEQYHKYTFDGKGWYVNDKMLSENAMTPSAMYNRRRQLVYEKVELYNSVTRKETTNRYRFKTERELKLEFGDKWKEAIYWNKKGKMDRLLGKDFPFDEAVDMKGYNFGDDGYWYISEKALKENTPSASSMYTSRNKLVYEQADEGNMDYYNIIHRKPTQWKYRFKTEDEFEHEYGNEWRNYVGWNKNGSMDRLFGEDLEEHIGDNFAGELYVFGVLQSWYIIKDMLTKNVPFRTSRMYRPNVNLVYEDSNNTRIIRLSAILEKSTLTYLGVPREVMQSIQEDFALLPDSEWEKVEYKKDVLSELKKGIDSLYVQIGDDSVRVFGCYQRGGRPSYFLDYYSYKEGDWGGEYHRYDREEISLTQLSSYISPKSDMYKLNGEFTMRRKAQRQVQKEEQSLVEFTESFKRDFLRSFDKILKRITRTNFEKAKGKITDKAKEIAIENDWLISSLDNPLAGPNGLSILDEFLYKFEDAYSKYFGERLDLKEMCDYFSRDKVMTMFMYFIYTGRILVA